MADLNDVAIFVHVARCGSFAAAARRLAMPPNSVSRRVQLLEIQLGARLMQRSTRKLTLTSAGQAFFERCAGMIDGLEEAQQLLLTQHDEPRGLVRLAAMANFFDFFPMEWVAEFLAAHPKVQIDFVLSDTRADLIEEQMDAAIRAGVLPDSSYVGRQLIAPRDGGLVASPAYLAARGTPQVLQDLAGHDCVTFRDPSGQPIWRLADATGTTEEVAVTGRFFGNTAQAICKAAVAGLGIALLPPGLGWLDLQEGRLVPVLAQYHCTGQALQVVYPSRRQVPLAVKTFIDFLIGKLAAVESLPQPLRSVVSPEMPAKADKGVHGGTRNPDSTGTGHQRESSGGA